MNKEEIVLRVNKIVNKCVDNFLFENHISAREFLFVLSTCYDEEDEKEGKNYINELEGCKANIIKSLEVLEEITEGVENFTDGQHQEIKEYIIKITNNEPYQKMTKYLKEYIIKITN